MIVNTNSIAQHVIQIKNGIINHYNVNVKIIVCAKKIIVGIQAHILASFYSAILWWNLSVIDIVSTKVTNIIATNVTSTILTYSDDKKVRYNWLLYFAYSFISDLITIDNWY